MSMVFSPIGCGPGFRMAVQIPEPGNRASVGPRVVMRNDARDRDLTRLFFSLALQDQQDQEPFQSCSAGGLDLAVKCRSPGTLKRQIRNRDITTLRGNLFYPKFTVNSRLTS